MLAVTREKEVELTSFVAPAGVRIGHVHLKVSDLERSVRFYSEALGFAVTQRMGGGAAFLSADGYHHHIGLNTWESKGAKPPPEYSSGLYHVAFLYSTRRDLAVAVSRLYELGVPLEGGADHGVSEAVYLRDPDNNGVELYWDKPKQVWPVSGSGELEMYTRPLNIEALLATLRNG